MSGPKGLPFEFDVPVGVWLNKAAPEGRQRRIGGLITTDNRDRQQEVVIQKGLDFGPWQQVYYAEFDGQRRKRVIIKALGE